MKRSTFATALILTALCGIWAATGPDTTTECIGEGMCWTEPTNPGMNAAVVLFGAWGGIRLAKAIMRTLLHIHDNAETRNR